uniref:Uncharacterized protein n=1 Tax=Podoviridae sp. ctuch15 TaxID=2827752 RepID=A0A8S5T1V6_9CAUD|nr:MAG TPA: hypothetical protein [Podoviridae sp. ctuch15]
MEQIGIGMILVGLTGILGATGKMIYKELGINDSIFAICGMIVIIGMVLTLIVAG